MKLYYFPLSTYSQKALIAFHEKGVSFEPQLVNLMDDEQRRKYREVYPLGKVPLLELDDGWKVPESSIIIEYLDTHYGGTRLIPEDPDEARQMRCHDRISDLYLSESITTLLFQGWKPEAQRDQEAIARSRYRAGVCYDYLEGHLASRRYMMGENFSMADCATAPALLYARDVFPFEDKPNITAYWQRLCERPSYAKVLQEAKPHLEAMAAKRG